MGLIVLLALQAATASPPMPRIDFDLADARPVEPDLRRCAMGEDDEIVVCGRRRRVDRFTPEEMEDLERRYAEGPPRVAMDLGGGVGGSFDFSPTPVLGGVISNRMAVTVKVPF